MNRQPGFTSVIRAIGLQQKNRLHRAHDIVLDYLNALPGKEGFVTANYSPSGPDLRRFFTSKNAKRIDAVRTQIEEWDRNGLLSHKEECYLLACLIEAADRVANTAGTYYAYLKGLYRKAAKPLRLLPFRIINNSLRNKAYCQNARELVRRIEADILYLDPPYNDREYGAYYHLPETLVLWDSPEVHGKSGIRTKGIARSSFCRRETATEALWEIVQNAHCKCILLHYTADGLISHRDILAIMQSRGRTYYTKWYARKYSSFATDEKADVTGQVLYRCLLN